MEEKEPELFIEKITINEVRHLKDVDIPISSEERKHLILTGKNGSGKTSVLEAIRFYMKGIITTIYQNLQNGKTSLEKAIEIKKKQLEKTKSHSNKVSYQRELTNFKKSLADHKNKLVDLEKIIVHLNDSLSDSYQNGKFIISFFEARRNITLKLPEGIKKIPFKKVYDFNEKTSPNFLQHIVNLKADRSFARDDNDTQVIEEVDNWFDRFNESLKFIFDDQNLKLIFNRKDYNFNIILESGQ